MSEFETTIYVEHCINCANHKWCTNHNEQKYSNYGIESKDPFTCAYILIVKKHIEEHFPDFNVKINEIPDHLRSD